MTSSSTSTQTTAVQTVARYGFVPFMLLGLNGIAVKSHGGADAFGFSNAIGVAVDMLQHGFLEKIRQDLERVSIAATPPAAAAL